MIDKAVLHKAPVLHKAREKYDEVEKGRKNGWFEFGEYEYLKQKWFDEYGDLLLKALEEKDE